MALTRTQTLLMWAALLLCLTALTSMRIDRVNALSDQGFFDKYPHFADSIVAGELPVHRLGDLSPGYLWSVVFLRQAGYDHLQIRTIQVILVSLAALLVAVAAWRWWGFAAACTAAFVILSSRAILLNATEIEPETLILVLSCAALACLLDPGGRAPWLAAGGLFMGLSSVTRPTALLAVGAIAIALALTGSRPRQRLMRPVVFVLAAVIPVIVLKLAYAAIPGATTLMNPGTVFYEGSNPATTGLAGDAPQVVKDLELTMHEPDALHEAYRLVADRAEQGSPDRQEKSNDFWSRRGRSFISLHPGPWLRLTARKISLVVTSHDAWDLATMVRKEREMSSLLWLPFAFPLVLALFGLAARDQDFARLALSFYLTAYVIVMLIFYVTGRQRCAMIPALALLAGLAVHHMTQRWQEGRLRDAVAISTAVLLVGSLLSVPTAAALEDSHTWRLADRATVANFQADEAQRAGDDLRASYLRAAAALLRNEPLPPSLAAASAALLTTNQTNNQTDDQTDDREPAMADRFDEALRLMAANRWQEADRMLAGLHSAGYSPIRGVATSSSLAYYRARCQLRTDHPDTASTLLQQAMKEAPGDARVLALLAEQLRLRGDEGRAQAALDQAILLHDPFSILLARAEALIDLGRHQQAWDLLRQLDIELPEWRRPAAVAATLPPTVVGKGPEHDPAS